MQHNKIKCLIIDDDPFIRDLLQDKLSQYLPEVEVLTTASSGLEGLQKIAHYQPDLVFLDVEMPDMTGFEMLFKLEDISFETIFITSYSHYAIKAIHFDALDYLVKPIDLGELKAAIKRYKKKAKNSDPSESIKQALFNWNTKNDADKKLVLQTQEGEVRLVLKDIVRIEGERNYSYIYLANDKRKLTTKTLGELEELLGDKGFFRCHKSHLVNKGHIQSLLNHFAVLLHNGFTVPIARRKQGAFRIWYAMDENLQNT
ncbi:MAG: DNA-binding response regulator [Bacteroidetes bacterium]|nr:MAG: DNA-binding response regulator [Bacteroidota bacterium]PTM11725.1 MAG: DNA-binding response regulator [Bacteroidota bacterium]